MEKLPLNPKHLLNMILLLILVIGFSFLLEFPIYIGILVSIIYIFVIALRHHYTFKELIILIRKSFITVKTVMSMLLLISAMLPIWMSSGTLPTLVNYSFLYLSSFNIPLSAFLISSFLSLMLGTFIGSLSILGPLFMSLAIGLSVPLPLVAGALISGAVLGDRLSPVSSNFHLICASCESTINDTFFALLKTNGPSFVISSFIYYILGRSYLLNELGQENIARLLELLNTHFSIDSLLIFPIILLLLLIMSNKVSIIKAFFIAYLSSLVIYIALGLPISQLLNLSIWGYHSSIEAISILIDGSGIYSMLAVPFIILCSAYLNDLLNYTNLINRALNSFSERIKTRKELYHKTAILSIIVTVISCNQSLTAIITGPHFRDHYKQWTLDSSSLARTIADSGSIIITIIPWNLNALVAASITGVSAFHYTPYAFYVLITLVITFLLPFLPIINNNKIANKTT